jgi:hypothetical protein
MKELIDYGHMDLIQLMFDKYTVDEMMCDLNECIRRKRYKLIKYLQSRCVSIVYSRLRQEIIREDPLLTKILVRSH